MYFSFTLTPEIIPDASLEDKVDESDAYAQNMQSLAAILWVAPIQTWCVCIFPVSPIAPGAIACGSMWSPRQLARRFLGVQTMEQLDVLLGFEDATPEERDYSIIGIFTADKITDLPLEDR